MSLFSLSNLKIVIVSHIFTRGASQELADYLKDKVKELVFIGHPFYYCEDTRSTVEWIKNGKLVKKKFFKNLKLPEFLSYLKDIIATFYFLFKTGFKSDIYIGVNCFNATLGVLLRSFRLCKKVIFYTIDYADTRYENKVFNFLYHLMDRIAAKYADYVWNVSAKISERRIERGINRKNRHPAQVVPIGTNFLQIKRLPVEQIERYRLAYVGGMEPIFGLQLLIEAFPEILSQVPQAELVVIGTGTYAPVLKEIIEKEPWGAKIDYKGFIGDHKQIEDILAKCSIGFAPYMPDKTSYKYYADVTKPKVYMASGLPVIITNVPPIAIEIAKREAGIVINYNKEELINATVKLLTDVNLYNRMRQNAIQFASEFQWDQIFQKALAVLFDEA